MSVEHQTQGSATADAAGRRAILVLFDRLGLTPAATEIDWMAEHYPAARAMVEALHTMPGVRYEEPVATFDPRTPSL